MAAIYDSITNTINLTNEDYTLNKIYSDINNPNVLSYDSLNNIYILNAKIISIGLANLNIENTTALMNNIIDDDYYIQVGRNLTVKNATIKSNNGKRFYIWSACKVDTADWSAFIDNTIIDGGWILIASARAYVQPNYPYVKISNTTIKNVDMRGVTSVATSGWSPDAINARLSPLSLPYSSGHHVILENIVIENVYSGAVSGLSQHGGVIMTEGNSNMIFRNISILNSYNYYNFKSAIFIYGSSLDLLMDNILIENFDSLGIAFKEGHGDVGKTNYYKDITIRNIKLYGINTYQNMGESNFPSGAKIENLIIDGGIYVADTLIYHGTQYTVYLWIFNAQLRNAAKCIKMRNNQLFFTNALVQNVSTMYNVIDSGPETGAANWYEILDVFVTDINNQPINGATVEILPDTIAPVPNSVDKWFNPKTSTTTGSDGHTPLPSDENGMLALLRRRDYNSGSVSSFYTYSIKASYHEVSIIISNIVPDTTWYRDNANIPMNTIAIQLQIDISCPVPICNISITQL